MSEGLVQFLRARLDEDVQAAKDAGGKAWKWEHGYGDMCNDPTCPYGELATDDTVLMQVHGYDIRSPWEGAAHIERHHPARVLAEIEAKRELLRQYEHLKYDVTPDDLTGVWAFEAVLRAFALPYADHPDYRDEWRP
ncbi:DUF6221 family protein [Streptomyces sp. QTS137]